MAVRAAAGTGYLTLPNALSGAPYTWIGWFRSANAAAGYTSLVATDNSGGSQYDYTAFDESELGIGSQSNYVTGGAVADNTWEPVVVTRTGNTRRVMSFRNGGSATNSQAEAAGYDIWVLLGHGDMSAEPARDVRAFKAWAALLTDEEIAAEFQQFAPVRTADLVHYSPFAVHTDLADDVSESSWTNNSATLSTVSGPTGVPDEWEGPRVASSATTVGTTSAGGLSINLPSGVAAGDLLMAFAANDTSVSWSAGEDWSLIDDGANGTAVQGACWAKIAAGSDTLTITGEANDIAVVVVRIPAAEHGVTDVTAITKGTAATGSNAAPNGPNCNPGTSGKWLWLTYYAADDDDNTAMWWPAEGAPVAQVKSATGTSSCQVGVAYRWLEASSYDPSAFALSESEEWRAQTFAISFASPVIEADGIASSATYGSATISNVTAQTISSSSLSSNAAFGSVTVAKVTAKVIAPNGLASSVALGTSAINKVPAKSITPVGLTSNIVFGSSVFSNVPSKEIEPNGLSSSVVFGSATLLNATPKDISFSGLVSNVSFGTALVAKATPKNITASGIVSATVVGDAVIGKASPKNISPNGIASSIDFGLTDLAGISIQTITVSSISSVATVGTQTVSKNTAKNVAVDGIVSSAVVGTHTITKINAQNISPDGITTNIQFGATFVDDGSGTIPDSSLRPLYRIAVSLGFDRR